MSEHIKKYISEFGREALFDTEKLMGFLNAEGVGRRYIFQLILIIECGNIRDYIDRDEAQLNGVEVNNIIIGCTRATGINQDTVKSIISDILISLNISFDYNKFFVSNNGVFTDGILDKINGTESYTLTESAFVSYEEIEKELQIAEDYQYEGESEKALEIYTKLAKVGSSNAMYYLGMCYLNGDGTEKNEKEAIKWLNSAAKNGDPRAKVKMGDYYYNNDNILKRDFRKAYENYSGIGVLTVEPRVKANIVNILNQKKINFITIILGAVLIGFMWIFLFLNPQSVHSSITLIGWGIPLTIISSAIYGLACYLYKKLKYNNLKIFMFAMLIIWSIYPLILALN